MSTVMGTFSIEKLDSLVEQLLDAAFGANTSAKEEWRRNEEMRAANEPNVQQLVDRPLGRVGSALGNRIASDNT
jgi:hypothetical protein